MHLTNRLTTDAPYVRLLAQPLYLLKMKLVIKNTDTFYLYSLKDLLEANGIPAIVQGENTARMVTPFMLTEPSLWVYFDQQQVEAIKLIGNPEYEVEDKIDVTEFYNEKNKLNQNDALFHLVLTLCAVIAGLYLIVKILQWLST